MRKLIIPFVLFCTVFFGKSVVFAEEGMWLPQLLEAINEADMKKKGMKISASDIYSINKSSLKDAIVSFGGFCTAEVISRQGLILTNHHCGFSAIQSHTSLQNNYIRDGFWAKSHASELKNEALTATFIIRIEDVTALALKNTNSALSEADRQSTIDKNLMQLKASAVKESYQDILVRPFFEGNKYYLFITETYKDVRLVGAPPAAIGNFGQDTDNWVWPRHTGDFSLFRIYADVNNKPAAYSPENVPYRPKRALNISLSGIEENDFTMVFGFPGRTNEYLYSDAVNQIMVLNDPAKIAIRDKALNILNDYMRKNELIKIQYASKYAGIQNAYKKWKGEVAGLKKSDAVGKKKRYEAEFTARLNANPSLKQKYGGLLDELDAAYKELEPLGLARDYYQEIIPKIELFTIATHLNNLTRAFNNNGETGYNETLVKVRAALQKLFKDYNGKVDQDLFAALMEMYLTKQTDEYIAPAVKDGATAGVQEFAANLYRKSVFADSAAVMHLLDKSYKEVIEETAADAATQLLAAIQTTYFATAGNKINTVQNQINILQRKYMQAQIEVFKEKPFYPDANSTLRVTYGNVKPYRPADGVSYGYYTTLEGVMEKYIPGDYEFDLPEKLIDLYNKKDFGRYAVNGKQPVCFIASNHTTGGNSGSPALDAYGNLIGLNFDRVWEGTMSDINYDAAICRNIMVDIRYVLFIIDKFADAQNIMEELNIVYPKKAQPDKSNKPKSTKMRAVKKP